MIRRPQLAVAKARRHGDLVMIVGHTATISLGEWVVATNG
jgi:hypothetical protein